MSAYVVDENHINYLIHAGLTLQRQYGLRWVWNVNRKAGTYESGQLTRENAEEVGQKLWDENIRSVEFRYPDCIEDRERMPGPVDCNFDFHYRIRLDAVDPLQVLMSCACYRYQSCEHHEWPESEACAIIEALEDKAISCLPGYEDCTWGAPKAPDSGHVVNLLDAFRKDCAERA